MATGGRTKYDPTKMMPGPSRTAQMDDSVSFYVDGCVVIFQLTKTYFRLETIAVRKCFMVFFAFMQTSSFVTGRIEDDTPIFNKQKVEFRLRFLLFCSPFLVSIWKEISV